MDVIYWDSNYNSILFLNLGIVIALFVLIRLFIGAVAHVDTANQLFKKDNPAFGLSLAGVIFATTIMLSGLVYGGPEADLIKSATRIGIFGVTSLAFLILARLILDKITLPDISLRREINKGNIAVAIADVGNVLAAAIILRAIMIWITDDTQQALLALFAAYGISQLVLTSFTVLRRKFFDYKHTGHSLQDELKKGNIAIGIAFAGRKIGTAMAFAVAANIVVYEVYDVTAFLLPWAIVAIAVIIILKILSFITENIILFGHNLNDEILQQRNIAAGALRAIIYISLAFLVAEL